MCHNGTGELMLYSIKKWHRNSYSDVTMLSMFVMPMSNKNIQCNDTLNVNLNPTSNEIEVNGFQSKKCYEHVNLMRMLKVFKNSFPTEDLDFMPSMLNNNNNKLLIHAKHHSNKSTLKILNITKKLLQKPGMIKQMKKVK